MRSIFACSAVALLGACATIVGLEEPTDAPLASADAGTDASSPSVPTDAPAPPPSDAGADGDAGPDPCSAPGLLAYWRLDEGSGSTATDCSPGKHHGSVAGATWTAGKVGPGALSFSGDSVDIGNPPELQLTGAMTLSVWVKIDSFATAGRILSKSSQTDRGWEINVDSGDVLEIKIATGATSYLQASTSFVAGEWKHVAGVFQPGIALRLYVDGVEVDARSTNVPSLQRNSPHPVRMGEMPNESCCRLDGTIDDVRIYGRALTAAEVLALAKP